MRNRHRWSGVLCVVFVLVSANGWTAEIGTGLTKTRPEMKQRIEALKQREARIPLPVLSPEEIAAGKRSVNNGRLRSLYLPESWQTSRLSTPNIAGSRPSDQITTRSPLSQAQSAPDYAFKTRLFWIVSRTNDCQYCLGHQELKLKRAGMTDDQIASLDCKWTAFPADEQAAMRFARKATLTPHLVTDDDIVALKQHFKDEQVIDIVQTVAGYNSTNRWTASTGIPQDKSFGGDEPSQLDTPTSPEFANVETKVAPFDYKPRMGPSEGWFGPAESRYSFAWLAEHHGVSPGDGINAATFEGEMAWFARLDRNRDGTITAEDLDWSDRNSWVQHAYIANRLFRRMDPDGDGKLARQEWLAFFDAVADGRNEINSEELREVWLAGLSSNFLPGDAPASDILLESFFAGEVGSLQEGPRVNESAPDFALKTHDGSRIVRLSEVIGSKPVVLVFGNFTCGPFRSMYPGVEDVYRRFKEEAVFLGVYVREAHPTDGWKMESNTKVGVTVAQPKTFAERTGVAQQCHRLLKPSIPLLVDEIDDSTGNAYSGMPARLYVIDAAGKVAYKSGRGPFGFKTGEMEQALIMTRMDVQKTKQ